MSGCGSTGAFDDGVMLGVVSVIMFDDDDDDNEVVVVVVVVFVFVMSRMSLRNDRILDCTGSMWCCAR